MIYAAPVAPQVNGPTPCPASSFCHSRRDVHTAVKLARLLVQRQGPSSPILAHHLDPFSASYRMRVFLVLDPQPAVTQSVSRQRPGPLSARAKRRNATQRSGFKTAHE